MRNACATDTTCEHRGRKVGPRQCNEFRVSHQNNRNMASIRWRDRKHTSVIYYLIHLELVVLCGRNTIAWQRVIYANRFADMSF